MSGPLDDLRAQVTENDLRIVAAVNERLRLVSELWELKRTLGVEQLDRNRERELREELARSNGGPLSREGLERLVTELLALTKRELGPG